MLLNAVRRAEHQTGENCRRKLRRQLKNRMFWRVYYGEICNFFLYPVV
jgi:hypothetical protein